MTDDLVRFWVDTTNLCVVRITVPAEAADGKGIIRVSWSTGSGHIYADRLGFTEEAAILRARDALLGQLPEIQRQADELNTRRDTILALLQRVTTT